MLSLPLDAARRETLDHLREQLHECEGRGWGVPQQSLSCGYTVLDRLLPADALRRGTLVEWLAAEGSGAATLALALARAACIGSRWLVVIDRRADFYPPAAAAQGIDLRRTLLVRPATPADAAWALDQSLRSAGVGAVLAWPEETDSRSFRRWQLAASAGGSVGLFVRPKSAQCEPSWAAVRWLIDSVEAPAPTRPALAGAGAACQITRRLRVELLRARGGVRLRRSGAVEVDLDDETGALHLVAPERRGERTGGQARGLARRAEGASPAGA